MNVPILKVATITLALAVVGEPTVAWAGSPGEEIYFRVCATCHGEDGDGAMPGIPDLSGNSGPLSKPIETLVENVVKGIEHPDAPVSMPPFGGDDTLSRENLFEVLKYMQGEFAK